jgi:hypothetical protein
MKTLVLAGVIIATTFSSVLATEPRNAAGETPTQYHSPTNRYGYDSGYPDNYKPVAGKPADGPTVGQTWIGYCSHKYKSYDPVSNTYWGADGKQYICKGE